MNFKRRFWMAAVLIIALMLAGCSGTSKRPESSDNEEIKEDTASDISGNVIADLPGENQENLSAQADMSEQRAARYKVKYDPVDIIDLKNQIFPDDDSEYVIEEDEEGKMLSSQNGLNIVTTAYHANGSTEKADVYDELLGFADDFSEEMNIDTSADLEFLDRDSVKQEAEKVVGELVTFPEIGEVEVEAFTDEYLNTVTEIITGDADYSDYISDTVKNKTWSADEGVYRVKIHFLVDGVQVDSVGLLNIDPPVWGMEIMILRDKEGIQEFNILSPLESLNEEESDIISCQEALDGPISAKYNNIIMQNPITVNDAKLQYNIVTDNITGEMYLTPVWLFQAELPVEKEGARNVMHVEIPVDAVSGRLLG